MMSLLLATVLIAALALARAIQIHGWLREAYTDPAYGILTRAGGERAWRHLRRRDVTIIFTDLDAMHDANERLGYAEVDRRVAATFATRATDTCIAMRWYSGDELVAVVPRADGLATAERLLATLQAHGLSGTFGVVDATNPDLAPNVRRAAALVQRAKAAHQRGIVITEERPC